MLLLTLVLALGLRGALADRVCTSINVRNTVNSLRQLRGCAVVEGYVQVVLIERANESDFAPWSFPELREVTDYLLFYRVPGLRRLGQLFPNLARIGGTTLFLDYGLVVHEMFGLREVGLRSLSEITRGSVIVTKNPSLCYVHTVDWNRIAPWDPGKNYLANNKPSRDCPRCPTTCPDSLCWSRDHCQIQELPNHCHPLCVGGCTAPGPRGCHSCKGFLTADGECTSSCPSGTYQYLKRRCLTQEECVQKAVPSHLTRGLRTLPLQRHLVFNNSCVDGCPAGYELDTERKSCEPCRGGRCLKHCPGMSVENIGDAQALRGCTHIDGSLEISIRAGKPTIVMRELEDSLGSIEEIGSYLKVVRSFPISNLNFLRNLTTIRGDLRVQGDAGFGDNYSFLVLDNENLQELWQWDKKKNFRILNGKVFFHFNPKLCLQHIHKFLSVIHHENPSDLEIGKDSNGDKFICNATSIDIRVIFKTSSSIEINIPYFKTDYGTEHLRYVVYFTKALHRNVTLLEDFDLCSDLRWRTKDFSVDPNDRQFISGGFRVNLIDLEPYTQYAFYVTTYTVDRYGAKSTIKYETTLPSKPSELQLLQAFSNSSSEITLVWNRPRNVNGKIKEYIVTWTPLPHNNTLIGLRNYCKNPLDYESIPDTFLLPPIKEELPQKKAGCCKSPFKISAYTFKDGFEKLCSSYVHCPFRTTTFDKDVPTLCESCFYSLVYNPPFPPLSSQSISLNVSRKNRQQKLKIDSSSLQKESTKSSIGYTLGNATGFTLTKLRHFQDYLVTVRVCREPHPMEPDQSIDQRCSDPELITVRTLRDNNSDKVSNVLVTEFSNDSVLLCWDPPSNPNSLVVAFEVEYRHAKAENVNPIVNCLTYAEYESNKKTYPITGLVGGSYEVRVRAITLAGKGPFINDVYFQISPEDFSAYNVLFLTIALCFIIIGVSVGITMNHRKKKILDILVASVNPDYHHQYIEDHWEIPKDEVEIVRELGAGSFGKVYQGLLKSTNQQCAIKTVSDDVTQYGIYVFLSEASVMKSVVEAYHIVRLLGVVSTVRPPLVIMELMDLGDLKSYLRSKRGTDSPTSAEMLRMSYQIGDGMAFLETKKYVHRDLAARNCLVNQDRVVKVGDFGMTRDVYETDYYRKVNTGMLPIRWMAPESLQDGLFTSHSDVWSFGVVIWELTTLAEQPYQGASNEQVLTEVIDGRKLDIPPQAPEPLKEIMTSCWKRKPSQRMSFMQIVKFLAKHHDQDFKKVAYFYTLEAQRLRNVSSDYVEMQSVEDPLLGQPVDQPRLSSLATFLSRVKSRNKGEVEVDVDGSQDNPTS